MYKLSNLQKTSYLWILYWTLQKLCLNKVKCNYSCCNIKNIKTAMINSKKIWKKQKSKIINEIKKDLKTDKINK